MLGFGTGKPLSTDLRAWALAAVDAGTGFPHGQRNPTTLVAGLRLSGMVAPILLDGPINGDWFEAYVRHVLAPTLRPGDVGIMDRRSPG